MKFKGKLWFLLSLWMLISCVTFANNEPLPTTIKLSAWTDTISVKPETIVAWQHLKDLWITKIDPTQQDYKSELSRWEAALLFLRFTNKNFQKEINEQNNCVFKDVLESKLDENAKKEITIACKKWLFKGYSETTFGLHDDLLREQAVLVLARILNDNIKNVDNAYDYLLKEDIIKRDDRLTWNTKDKITREQLFLILYRASKWIKNEKTVQKLEQTKELFDSVSEEEEREINKMLIEKVLKNIDNL